MSVKKYEYVKRSFTFEGKRYFVYGKSERDAQKKMIDLKIELQKNGIRLDGSTTVRKWAQQWLEVYIDPSDITAKSAAMYRQKLDGYILPAIGHMKLKDVRDTHLQKLLNKANSSKSTAQKVKITLQRMFKQARKSKLIAFDPAEDLHLPKAPEGKGRSITDFERRNILEVAEYHRGGLYVLTVLYCGLRPNECIALQWKDIDLKDGWIHVRSAAESGNSASIKDPKTAAGIRSVPTPSPLLAKLRAAKPKGAEFQPVFLQPKGRKRHTESSLNDLWNNFKRELDIHMGAKVYRNQILKHCWELRPMAESQDLWESLIPYCLRHTFGTDCQRAGIPINVTKYLMGHSDISVTANIYIDTTPDVLEAAVSSLDALHTADVIKSVVNPNSDAGQNETRWAV